MGNRLLLGYVFVMATLFCTVAGQILMKWRASEVAQAQASSSRLGYILGMFSDFYVWGGLGMAFVASVCWMLAIQNMPTSVAYPFMALSFLFVPLIAAYLFRESLTPTQILGMVLIVGGVAMTSLTK